MEAPWLYNCKLNSDQSSLSVQPTQNTSRNKYSTDCALSQPQNGGLHAID